MDPNQLIFDEEAARSLQSGVDVLARTVSATLGPKGGYVHLERSRPRVLVTRDGARVAREIQLADRGGNAGAQLLDEAARKTKNICGDGATTTVVLAQCMVAEGLHHAAAGVNPMVLRRGIEQAAAVAVRAIRGAARPVADERTIAALAATCTGDPQMGTIIGQVMEHVTRDGAVIVAESKGIDVQVEFAEGYHFDRGYLSTHFVTNAQRMEAVVNAPHILVTNQRIASADDIMPLLRRLAAARIRNLVVIAEEVEGQALTILITNKQKENLQCVAVKAPEFGEQYMATLQDLAIATGARLIAAQRGEKVRDATPQDCGRATRVVATKEQTTIIHPAGDAQAIADRAQQIQSGIGCAANLYEKERLEKRLARLTGQMAVVRVGAAHPLLLQERRRQLQHAVIVAKGALDDGVVPGGGVTFVHAAAALQQLDCESDAEQAGVQIVQRALLEPMLRMAENAGQNGAVVVNRVLRLQQESANPHVGYDVLADAYVDMVQSGILDSARTATIALENAASVATMILTVGAVVISAA